MSTNAYVNLDARWLWDLANVDRVLGRAEVARLIIIAQRVESMDAKLARHIDGTFEAGVGLGALRASARSNVLRQSKIISNDEGETLIAAIESTPVQHLKIGERARQKAKVQDATAVPHVAARKGWRITDL